MNLIFHKVQYKQENSLISESPISEAVFRGREGVKYDLNHIGGEPIITSVDKISLYFKTRKSSGLLFYNGEFY